jgi:hypothetical protein
MIDYVKDLPEYVKLSDYLKGKADGYLVVQVYGKSHYVPLTKDIKKRFNISRKNKKIVFGDFKSECVLDDMIRIIADSLYLQTRDTVGTEIREEVVKIVEDRISDLLAPIAQKEIDAIMEKMSNTYELPPLDMIR